MRPTYLRSVMTLWGFLVATVLVIAMTALADPFDPESFGPGHDARAYWSAPLDDPYEPGSVGQESAYLYSPAFLVAVSPLRGMPWPLFVGLWTTVLLVVLFWLSGPLLFLPLVLLTLPELWGGNITILLAASVVVGFGRSSAWLFALLTKVTPGLGIMWFAFRREWLPFGQALAATGLVIAVTAFVTPGLWGEWFALLSSSTGSSTVPGSVPIPLVLRLPFAIAIVAIAAVTDRRWLLPIGVLIAMPVIWWGSLALLTACVALKREEIETRIERGLALIERWQARRIRRSEVPASG